MQAIAREFNLSESVFILPPDNPRHRARVRIFTPDYEMPFAGHPTVGSAIALAEQAADDGTAGMFVLEENIGPVRCAVTKGSGATFAEFDLPKLPEQLALSADAAALGAALGLGPHEIGFENHRAGLWSAGVPYVADPGRRPRCGGQGAVRQPGLDGACAVPRARALVASRLCLLPRDGASRQRLSCAHVRAGQSLLRRSGDRLGRGCLRRRDPAFRQAGRRVRALLDRAGHRDGPASRIRLEIDVEGGKLAGARIGGHAVKVAEGVLYV